MQNNKCDTHPGSERLQSSRAQPRRDAHSVCVLQCVKLFHFSKNVDPWNCSHAFSIHH